VGGCKREVEKERKKESDGFALHASTSHIHFDNILHHHFYHTHRCRNDIHLHLTHSDRERAGEFETKAHRNSYVFSSPRTFLNQVLKYYPLLLSEDLEFDILL